MEYKKERIKGYEEYFVDTNGVVYSKKDKPLKYSLNHRGYCIVNFMVNGIRKGFGIHTLVANQFIPNNDKTKTQVNHKDGDKTHNHVENLEWVTPLENTRHKIKVLGKNTIGKNNANAKAIKAYDIETNQLIYKFDSLADACRFLSDKLHISFKSVQSSIWRTMNDYRKSYKGLIWKYA